MKNPSSFVHGKTDPELSNDLRDNYRNFLLLTSPSFTRTMHEQRKQIRTFPYSNNCALFIPSHHKPPKIKKKPSTKLPQLPSSLDQIKPATSIHPEQYTSHLQKKNHVITVVLVHNESTRGGGAARRLLDFASRKSFKTRETPS